MNKAEATILVIDDDKDVLISSELLLKRHFTEVITRDDPSKINKLISTRSIDIVVLDMNYRLGFNDGKEGLYWLEFLKEICPDTVIILMTAYGEVELAVQSIKSGAFDFILKPWNNDKFLATVRAALKLRKSNLKISALKNENRNLKERIEFDFGPIIGKSDSTQHLRDTLSKICNTQANVLILGENGTGKEHLARKLHNLSDQKDKPFIHVDLGSIAESLFESELFGHKRGSFTDAKEDKTGRFELANDGTIFLDEIANLPLHLQTKLLTVLEDRKVTRVGDGIERKVNARMLFATNAPLKQLVENGKFRQDLYYRIRTIEILIPPLRKRKEDIPDFLNYFLKKFKFKYNKPELVISPEAESELINYSWPGNIRELQHTLERGVILSDGVAIHKGGFNLIPEDASDIEVDMDNMNLKETEYRLLKMALKKHKGNISRAAEDLGLTRAALYRRMEKFDL